MASPHCNMVNNEMTIVQIWLHRHDRALRNLLHQARLLSEVVDTTKCCIAAAKQELARVLEDWTQISYQIQRYLDGISLCEYIDCAFPFKESFLATISEADAFLRNYALQHTGERSLNAANVNNNSLIKPRLPKQSLPKFNGTSPLKWMIFWQQFCAIVH